jgi:Ni,Fe-hydrogenase III component G
MTADHANREKQHGVPLSELSPQRIARMIRSLDSRLIGIAYDERGDVHVLVYTFEVAGKKQEFPVVVDPTKLVSIADLYPAAAEHEGALQEQFGLMFQNVDDA